MIEKLKEKLTIDDLKEMLLSINSYDNRLENLDYQENSEDFFSTYYNNNPYEVARAIYYGDYNFSDEYVKINVYGNLESISEYTFNDLVEEYKEEIITEYLDIIEEDTFYFKEDRAYKIIQDLKNEG